MFAWVMLAFIALVFSVGQICPHPISEEPMCNSRFDFESKLLERTVLVEHRMNLMEQTTKKELEDLQIEKIELQKKVAELERDLKEEQKNKINELVKISEELKSNVSTELDKIEQNSNDLESNHIQYMYAIKSAQSDFETKINASITEIRDTISKPNSAVAFYFRDPHTDSPNQNTLLRFTHKITNTDAVYDPDTGYFTSPAIGVYLFVVQICGFMSRLINFRIYVNDDYVSDTTEYDIDSTYHCTSTSAVTILKQGDKVSVKTGPNTNSGQTIYSSSYRWSTFMGVLVQRV